MADLPLINGAGDSKSVQKVGCPRWACYTALVVGVLAILACALFSTALDYPQGLGDDSWLDHTIVAMHRDCAPWTLWLGAIGDGVVVLLCGAVVVSYFNFSTLNHAGKKEFVPPKPQQLQQPTPQPQSVPSITATPLAAPMPAPILQPQPVPPVVAAATTPAVQPPNVVKLTGKVRDLDKKPVTFKLYSSDIYWVHQSLPNRLQHSIPKNETWLLSCKRRPNGGGPAEGLGWCIAINHNGNLEFSSLMHYETSQKVQKELDNLGFERDQENLWAPNSPFNYESEVFETD